MIHRAIPYPVFLVSTQGKMVTLSWRTNIFPWGMRAKVVVDRGMVGIPLLADPSLDTAFMASLTLDAQAAANLHTLYQGWMNRIGTCRRPHAGPFMPLESPERASECRGGQGKAAQQTVESSSGRGRPPGGADLGTCSAARP
ncbi:MAG: DUF4391 domain-containing protein [Nitrospirae bacterium]|nr:DUF4391 domain-containing protein [Magnetococcales bacterium]